MATNMYFSQGSRPEQQLYEEIIIESLKIYGQDIYYLPRDIVNKDNILNEDANSRFNSSYKIEMYIENIEGFDGEGDLFTKFGVEIRDQATFIVAKKRWEQTVARYDNELEGVRPFEGDLLYIPFSKKLFEITHVEHEQPFYQLKDLPTYKLRCELFEFSGEDFDTDITDVDDIARDYGYEYLLTLDSDGGGFTLGETVNQTFSSGIVMSGEVSRWSDSDLILGVINAGADDGLYHTFVTGRSIVGTIDLDTSAGELFALSNVVSVAENNQLSNTEQNTYFDTLTDFLDFSESNPFGDPE
tara:strand:- start:21235 stop:22134 length:900 start_codon:yes stop_codon:yes gene_type:complete